jgi:hypothetical protein
MVASEYKHVVRGHIFLKHIPDPSEESRARLDVERKQNADPEDPDAKGIYWVAARRAIVEGLNALATVAGLAATPLAWSE